MLLQLLSEVYFSLILARSLGTAPALPMQQGASQAKPSQAEPPHLGSQVPLALTWGETVAGGAPRPPPLRHRAAPGCGLRCRRRREGGGQRLRVTGGPGRHGARVVPPLPLLLELLLGVLPGLLLLLLPERLGRPQ